MTPEDAIKFIDMVRSQTTLTGSMHDQYRIALQTLVKALGDKQPVKPSNERPTS